MKRLVDMNLSPRWIPFLVAAGIRSRQRLCCLDEQTGLRRYSCFDPSNALPGGLNTALQTRICRSAQKDLIACSHYENMRDVRIVKRGALVRFWERHPDAKASLESWYAVVRRANWKTPAEMKQVYGNADLVGRRTVFNIAGNKYRLVARVNYQSQRVFVLYILTHAEYDRGDWKQ